MSFKSLYICNLHEDVTEEMLKQKFAVAGNIVSAKIHQNGRFVFAYVNFGDHIEAKHALETMNGDEIKGVAIQIRYNRHDPALQNAKNANIIIKNLDKNILTNDLKRVCSQYGTILSIKIPSDEKGSKGYGYVNYENEEQAQNAIASLHRQRIGRTKVFAEKFIPPNERANNSSNVNSSQQRHSSENAHHYVASSYEVIDEADFERYDFVEKSPSIIDSKLRYLTNIMCGKYKDYCSKKINEALDGSGAKGRLAYVNEKILLVTLTEEAHIKCCQVLGELVHTTKIELPEEVKSKFDNKLLIAKMKSENLKFLGICLSILMDMMLVLLLVTTSLADCRGIMDTIWTSIGSEDLFKNLFIMSITEAAWSLKKLWYEFRPALKKEKAIEIASLKHENIEKGKEVIDNLIERFQHVAIMPCEEKHAKLLHKEFSTDLACRLSIVNEGLKFVGNKNVVLAEKAQLCKMKPMKTSFSVGAPKLSSLFKSEAWKKTSDDIENRNVCLLTPVSNSKPKKKQPAKKSLKYQVCQGNIADESSDAIVNGVSNDFNLAWGKVSPAILAKAGNGVKDQCLTNPVISAPRLRVTKSGNLSCKYIFHMVTPDSSTKLTKRIKAVLQNAETLGIKSISFPTLGAGGIGIDVLDVAMAMKKAFDEYFDENSSNSSIEAINVVVFESSLVPVFQQHSIPRCAAFIEDGDSSSSKLSSVLCDDEEQYDIEIIVLYKNNIALIKRELEKFMSQVIVEKELKENVSKLEEHDLNEIKKIGSDCSVSIKTVKSSGEKMVIRGFTKNVKSAIEKIEVIFKDLDVAMLVAKMSVWKREDSPGHFVRFPLRVSQILESNHEKKVKSCNVNVCGRDILVDLEKRTYWRSSKSGAVIREANNLDLPDHWTSMNNSAMMKVELVSGSSEYNRVRDLFQKSHYSLFGMGSSYSVSKIERIQNPTLYRQYAVKKKDVDNNLQGSQPAERELFHGTKRDDVDKICVDGFDRGFAGKNAAAYGKGCYFALNSKTSVGYCDRSGMKHMFLASVLTGNYCQGSPSLVKPPPMGFAANIRHYDSVVDNPNSPTIFVVFKDSSVYPQYLISFQ